jgi:ATP/maltotriose-dependent transcriptional regulator MalT
MNAEQAGEFDSALDYLQQSLQKFREIDEQRGIAQASFHLGTVAGRSGEAERGRRYLEVARGIWERLSDQVNVAFAICEIGRLFRVEQRLAESIDLLRWSLARLEAAGVQHGQGLVHYELGIAFLRLGEPGLARDHFTATIDLMLRSAVVDQYLAGAVEGLAEVAWLSRRPGESAQLLSSADAWRRQSGRIQTRGEFDILPDLASRLRRAMGVNEFNRRWAIGQLIPIDSAVELIDQIQAPEPTHSTNSDARHGADAELPRLTAQESRILCLIARGLSNQEIANELQIAVRTVTTHAQRIFGKLGVENRTHAAALAFHHGVCA